MLLARMSASFEENKIRVLREKGVSGGGLCGRFRGNGRSSVVIVWGGVFVL
jgi:hypothetical protein